MKIDDETIDRIATLARLEFTIEERKEISKDLGRIITFVEKIGEVNLDGVEPLIYITDEVNVLRPDIAKQDITKEQALKNAPKHDSDYFKAPKVVENIQR